ncbi:MAG: DegT/DnrJ/EryC1/StrS family aminotransferase [Terriglobales bacterium]
MSAAVPQPELAKALEVRVSPNGIVTFWRGRVALYAILKALGIGRGDVVLTPGFTCFAVPAAVCFCGARPVYVDIDPETYNITLDSVRNAYGLAPRGAVRAVLVQHTFGLPADIEAICAWARERQIAVIEDCAHVLGSRFRGIDGDWREAGSTGDAAFFSSQWTKPVTTGLGGWARINRPDLLEKVRAFRSGHCVAPSARETLSLAVQVAARTAFSSPSLFWRAQTLYQRLYGAGVVVGTSSPEELRGEMPKGYAKRMSRFQERLLQHRLADDSVQQHRRRLKPLYDAALQAAGLPTATVPDGCDPVLLRYPIRVGNKARAMDEARRRRIDLGDWYKHPIDRPEGLSGETFGYREGMCVEGERAAGQVVNLPMHQRIDEQAVEKIVRFVKEVA